jgi:hypothetical protein
VVGQRIDRPVTLDEKVAAVADLTRDDEVTAQAATYLLRRPAVARSTMRDDTTRMLVNRPSSTTPPRAARRFASASRPSASVNARRRYPSDPCPTPGGRWSSRPWRAQR